MSNNLQRYFNVICWAIAKERAQQKRERNARKTTTAPGVHPLQDCDCRWCYRP